MSYHKYNNSLTISFVISILLSSCFFTSSIVKQAVKEEYIKPKTAAIKNAYYENGILNINYISKKKESSGDSIFSLLIPVDTLVKIYNTSNNDIVYFDEQVRTEKKAIKAYKVSQGTKEALIYGNGLVMEIDNSAAKPGNNNDLEQNKVSAKVELLTIDTLFKPDLSESKKKNLKFMYHINDSPFNYIVFTIEHKKRKHLSKLFYLPLGIIGDVITFPVQAFLVIFRDKTERPAFFEFPNRITAGN